MFFRKSTSVFSVETIYYIYLPIFSFLGNQLCQSVRTSVCEQRWVPLLWSHWQSLHGIVSFEGLKLFSNNCKTSSTCCRLIAVRIIKIEQSASN